MKRDSISRRSLLGGMAGMPLAAPAILRGAGRRAGEKPNLLFILTDQQRADTMAAYGNHRYRVPVLNRLASESVVFDRCYATQPLCTPSRASLLTGLWPHTNGCTFNNIPLARSAPTLPEMLGDADYRTAYFGKWHLGDEPFAQRGFAEWASVEDGYNEHFSPGRDRSKRSDYHHYLTKLGYRPDEDDATFSRNFAVRRPIDHCKPAFLARTASDFVLRNQANPWMMCVGFLEPHRPYEGPLNDLHSAREAPIPANYPGLPVEREPEIYEFFRNSNRSKGYDTSDPAVIQRLNRNYAGLCTQVDRALGRILWALEVSGQADNTIIVYTADHGEMMGSHTLLTKMVMYEESVRVPLLIRAPFLQSRGVHVREPISNVHVAPTILELMGHQAPNHVQGESLTPLLRGGRLNEDHVFVEWYMPDGPTGRTVISPDGWKLALYQKDNALLFDRNRDPLEMSNLYYRDGQRSQIAGLRKKLSAWQKRAGDTVEIAG